MSRQFLVPLLLPADPTAALQAATKQYVDAAVGAASSPGTVLTFTFNATTTEPVTGNQVRLNNATQTAATLVWISRTTFDGLDVTTGLSRITSGYQIYMQDFDDATKWLLFDVTGAATDKTSYWEVPVVLNAGPGTIPAQKIALQTLTPASHGIPSGGADGDVLTKTSTSNYAVAWEAPTGGGTAPTGTKLTDLTAQTGAGLATTDIMETVDLSDTTMHASGTNKKLAMSDLITFLNANGISGGLDAEAVMDLLDTALVEGTGITLTYDDTAGTITIASTGGGAGTVVKVSALTAMGSAAATGDLIEVVDISDTTMAATGTNKKLMLSELAQFLAANGLVADADITSLVGTSRTITATAPVRIDGGASADLSANRTISLANDGVTNTQLATMPTLTLKGNITGGTAGPTDISQYDARGLLRRPIVASTGTAFAPVLATHENVMVTLSNASPVVVTLPSDATSNFPIGAETDYLWLGVGSCSFAQGASAVIVSSATTVTAPVMRIRYSAATAKKIAANTWAVIGDLA